MTLMIAFQMDPMEGLDTDSDTTFAMALEAQARGYSLWHYGPCDLIYDNGAVIAHARPMTVQRKRGQHCTLGKAEIINLAQGVDVILMRQDPPFDLAYITTTHLLDLVKHKTLVVNDPTEVRNAPEKLCITRFRDLAPPTLISSDIGAIRRFRAEHRDIVIKPLFGAQGAGVFHLGPEDENLTALLEMFAARSREPLMTQKYVPQVREGDKRIILIDGKPVGALNRLPIAGEARANLHVGGQGTPTVLTNRDHEICRAIGPSLRACGLIFVGIDVIGGYLTEINITSPTGLQEITRFTGTPLVSLFWDAVERKLPA